jgi:hypothetical protein
VSRSVPPSGDSAGSSAVRIRGGGSDSSRSDRAFGMSPADLAKKRWPASLRGRARASLSSGR